MQTGLKASFHSIRRPQSHAFFLKYSARHAIPAQQRWGPEDRRASTRRSSQATHANDLKKELKPNFLTL